MNETPQKKPLVSVIMCTYNGEKYIDEQMASIIAQDYTNIEIVIVDDCSNDNTFQKLLQWEKKVETVNVYQNKTNLGYNKNFAKAIQLAKGDYITLSDQDDIWMPTKVSASLNGFIDGEVTLVHCQNVSFEDGKLHPNRSRLRIPMRGSDTRQLFFFGQVSGHAMMFKKELLHKILPIPDGILYDLWITAVATANGKIEPIPQPLVHHRVHGKNFSLDKQSPSKKKELDLHETLKILGNIKNMKPEYKKCLHELLALLLKHNSKKYFILDLPLFLFAMRYRKVFFGHKRRLFPFLTHIKTSLKISRAQFVGKGKVL